eukprot:gene7910-10737_t
MNTAYSKIRTDVVIVIDVVNDVEKKNLENNLSVINILTNIDAFGLLMKAFTQYPVFSNNLLDMMGQIEDGIIFNDLVVGLDSSSSISNIGIKYHPFWINLTDDIIQDLLIEYRNFREYLLIYYQSKITEVIMENDADFVKDENIEKFIRLPPYFNHELSDNQSINNTVINILIIQSNEDHIIVNIIDIVALFAKCENCKYLVKDMSKLSIIQQTLLYSSTDILITIAGKSVYNSLFMKPNTVVIVLIQPYMCDWSWKYANQLLLLNLKPLIYCMQSIEPFESISTAKMNDATFSESLNYLQRIEAFNMYMSSTKYNSKHHYFLWSNEFWMEGPISNNRYQMIVDVNKFNILVVKALNHIKVIQEKYINNDYLFEHDPNLNNNDKNNKLYPLLLEENHFLSSPFTQTQRTRSSLNESHDLYLYVQIANILSSSDQNQWVIMMNGEIGVPEFNQNIPENWNFIQICYEIFVSSQMDSPYCQSIQMMDRFSTFNINVKNNNLINLHFWAMSGMDVYKLIESDLYLTLDCRLPFGL